MLVAVDEKMTTKRMRDLVSKKQEYSVRGWWVPRYGRMGIGTAPDLPTKVWRMTREAFTRKPDLFSKGSCHENITDRTRR
jgi:hypothetical protein